MIDIKLDGKYRLTHDGTCFIIKHKTDQGEKTYWTNIAYMSTLESAVKMFFNTLKLKDKSIKSLKALRDYYRETQEEINKLMKEITGGKDE